MPRNQEMMHIFKDIELVEHLGSGIPRILEAYPQQFFKFTENFLRMTFPNAWDLGEDEDIVEVTDQVNQYPPSGVFINCFAKRNGSSRITKKSQAN